VREEEAREEAREEAGEAAGEEAGVRRGQAITVAVGRFGPVVGRGLLQILGEDKGLRVVGSALDHAALEAMLARGRARVAILDEDSAVRPAVLRRLRAAPPGGSRRPEGSDRPDVGVVALAHRPTGAYARRVIALGVNVCLSTDAPPGEILGAVRLAAEGRQMLVSMSTRPARPAGRADAWSLTRREREVLELLAEGHKNAEIGEALEISTETARTHAKNVYRKLGVCSRKELLGVGG
jgi:DNA-binding NarL/FixJ family response regulator